MNVNVNRIGVATYVSCDAPIIEENIVEFDVGVEEALTAGARDLVVDLKHVPFIDSKGLEFLLDLHDRILETGGSLRAANANSLCRDILRATRVDQTIRVFESLEEVGRSFM